MNSSTRTKSSKKKPITFVLTASEYGGHFFDLPPEEVHFGHRASIGSCHIAVNELGEANITRIRVDEAYRTMNVGAVVFPKLIAVGVKAAVWTKSTGGRKRIVRRIFKQNCTPEEIRRFQAVIDAERSAGLNIMKDPDNG